MQGHLHHVSSPSAAGDAEQAGLARVEKLQAEKEEGAREIDAFGKLAPIPATRSL
jgi:hypothetical protein